MFLYWFAVDRDLWHGRGYEIYYESTPPDSPHLDVIPIWQILGACQVMPLYCNTTATIPNWAKDQKAQAFPYGCSDSAPYGPTKIVLRGSKTYLLNKLALKYSR